MIQLVVPRDVSTRHKPAATVQQSREQQHAASGAMRGLFIGIAIECATIAFGIVVYLLVHQQPHHF